ncbi:MAG: pyruvate dehydrogenase complex E1 component subunit beta [Dehalococcoidia bacterium]|nr:pyruvate dehydrogenase complex E1 component subunit beta [Dehalococcoidia bacterium]
MAQVRFLDALSQTIREEMRRDPSIFVMGEDVRQGVYGVTAGLWQEFGDKRVLDTPLSETAFMGAAVGAAAVGMRPIVGSLSSFMWVAMDQFVNQVAKMKYMFGGQARLPIVYRVGMTYGNNIAAHHSDRPHPLFMNIPGFKIVMPTTPYDAKGLLRTAIRDDDPVLFFEDNSLMGIRGEVPDGDYTIPFGVADIKRPGTDVTIVALGGMMRRALAAAEQLAQEGISAEVVDPRSLVPLDKQTILDSVAKTGRLVVVDPAHKTCSAASEICAMVAQEGFWTLQAPAQRVCSLMVHFPFSPALEKHVFPNEEKIIAAVKRTLE